MITHITKKNSLLLRNLSTNVTKIFDIDIWRDSNIEIIPYYIKLNLPRNPHIGILVKGLIYHIKKDVKIVSKNGYQCAPIKSNNVTLLLFKNEVFLQLG